MKIKEWEEVAWIALRQYKKACQNGYTSKENIPSGTAEHFVEWLQNEQNFIRSLMLKVEFSKR
jgi:hypothetical protein